MTITSTSENRSQSNNDNEQERTMKHTMMMVVGCGLALLLIFLLPAMGLRSGWVLPVAFGAMVLCHLMHFGMHKDEEKGEDDHERRH
jgi:cell division protein FtsW (lipid II flippase)